MAAGESPQEMVARADRVMAKCWERGTASLADVANLRNGIHELAERLDDAEADIGDLTEQMSDFANEDRQLEDARALAKALLDRLRDYVSDEDEFGDGMSWATLPDWIGSDAGRDMWNYGADNDIEGADQS